MNIKQSYVDDVAKQTEGLLATIMKTLENVHTILTPDAALAESRPHDRITAAGAKLSAAIRGLATLDVSLRWQTALERALASSDGNKNTMEAVSAELRNFLLQSVSAMEEVLNIAGPFAHLFNQCINEQLARTVHSIDTAIHGNNLIVDICTKHGIDYAAVQAGDKDAMRQVFESFAADKGQSVNHQLLQVLGLEEPGNALQAAQADDKSPAELAANLGIDLTTFGGDLANYNEPVNEGIRA